jgi:two-component system, OmpR family, heavy metal sensor histidine kinase CusS
MSSTQSNHSESISQLAFRHWSITRRLTMLYVASTAALLVLAAGFLYWTLKHNLEHTRQGLLASKLEIFRRLLLEHPTESEVLINEVEHEASGSQPFKYFIRIIDHTGYTHIETTGMSDLVRHEWFPPPIETGADLRATVPRHLVYRGSSLLVSANAKVSGNRQRTIQIAMDVSNGAALLADYRNKLFIALGLGLVFAAVAGVWVARRGMRPLIEITKVAQHVTASQLHDRIAARRWPAELADLAGAFDAMLDRLEDSFGRLSQFSADLAHALRTPIHNLRLEVEVALARDRAGEEYRQVLTSTLEECERLSRMIDALLFLARTDNVKTAVKRVSFDVRAEMEAVREFYEALASEQEVTVTCEGQARLTGDPMLFRRAVSNLLGNALRHTGAGGAVHMSVRSAGEEWVEVSVQDNGRGIAPEHLSKIFDRFYSAGDTRSSVPGGIGLGLAIVQAIMRLHGGTARVESDPGKGARFRLAFPGSAGSPTKMTEL